MTDQILDDAALFGRIRHWKEFRATAGHLFPSDNSFRWFIRTHEQALLDSGVMLKLPRGNYLDPDRFPAVAMRLMRHAPA